MEFFLRSDSFIFFIFLLIVQKQRRCSLVTRHRIRRSPNSTPEIPVYQKFDCIPSSESPETGFVIDVIDGDSIKAKIGDDVYEIRYIGINTPEYYSSEKAEAELATLENRRLVKGKKIYLFKDRSNTDKYHRLLRYVFTNEYFVNYEMVKSGLAESKSYFPDTSCQVFFNQAVQ